MEAKTETSLTGSRLPGRERSTWPAGARWSYLDLVREYLPAFTFDSSLLSLFLPFSLSFPPASSSLLSSSICFFLFFFLLLRAGLPTSGGGPPRCSLATTFILGPYHTDTRAASRFTQIRRERLLREESVERRERRAAAELVPPLKP